MAAQLVSKVQVNYYRSASPDNLATTKWIKNLKTRAADARHDELPRTTLDIEANTRVVGSLRFDWRQ